MSKARKLPQTYKHSKGQTDLERKARQGAQKTEQIIDSTEVIFKD